MKKRSHLQLQNPASESWLQLVRDQIFTEFTKIVVLWASAVKITRSWVKYRQTKRIYEIYPHKEGIQLEQDHATPLPFLMIWCVLDHLSVFFQWCLTSIVPYASRIFKNTLLLHFKAHQVRLNFPPSQVKFPTR